MNERDDTVYLRHMLDAIAKVEKYLQGVDEKRFAQNTLLQDGVIRQLEIIGEAWLWPDPKRRKLEKVNLRKAMPFPPSIPQRYNNP